MRRPLEGISVYSPFKQGFDRRAYDGKRGCEMFSRGAECDYSIDGLEDLHIVKFVTSTNRRPSHFEELSRSFHIEILILLKFIDVPR
jgi:hypothetical protein